MQASTNQIQLYRINTTLIILLPIFCYTISQSTQQVDMQQQDQVQKQSPKNKSENDQNLSNEQEECFSSFESNHGLSEYPSATTVDGFRNMHGYQEKMLQFPEVPSQVGKLYQIYLNNVNRKKELQKMIEGMIEKQIKAIRIAYDKQSFALDQFIVLDEKSKDFITSEENYLKRKADIDNLNRQYRELKIMHVETMMSADPLICNALMAFTSAMRKVIHVDVRNATILVLSIDKSKVRKLRRLKQKKGTKKLKSEDEHEEEILEKGCKSRNTSRSASEDEEDTQEKQKIKQKYVIRRFNFIKTQNGIFFQPSKQLVQLPDHPYTGFVYLSTHSTSTTNYYICHSQTSIWLIQSSTSQPSSQSQTHHPTEYSVDNKISFCQWIGNLLYVGTKDGIVRRYEIQTVGGYRLCLKNILMAAAPNQDPQHVSFMAMTTNPDILLFVLSGKRVYELNFTNFTTHLLTEIPEEVQFMDDRVLITNNCYYLDYYLSGGRASLKFNKGIRDLVNGRKLIRVQKVENEDYVIIDEGNGVFVVQRLVG